MAINHPVINFRPADVGGKKPSTTGWFNGNAVLESHDAARVGRGVGPEIPDRCGSCISGQRGGSIHFGACGHCLRRPFRPVGRYPAAAATGGADRSVSSPQPEIAFFPLSNLESQHYLELPSEKPPKTSNFLPGSRTWCCSRTSLIAISARSMQSSYSPFPASTSACIRCRWAK